MTHEEIEEVLNLPEFKMKINLTKSPGGGKALYTLKRRSDGNYIIRWQDSYGGLQTVDNYRRADVEKNITDGIWDVVEQDSITDSSVLNYNEGMII